MSKPDTTSQIMHHASGATSIVGPDAMNLYRAAVLKQALKLYASHKILATRAITPTSMLVMATEYTGKKYKRGQHAQAAADVDVWVQTMKAGMPIVREGEGA
jgi:hypothetical protein